MRAKLLFQVSIVGLTLTLQAPATFGQNKFNHGNLRANGIGQRLGGAASQSANIPSSGTRFNSLQRNQGQRTVSNGLGGMAIKPPGAGQIAPSLSQIERSGANRFGNVNPNAFNNGVLSTPRGDFGITRPDVKSEDFGLNTNRQNKLTGPSGLDLNRFRSGGLSKDPIEDSINGITKDIGSNRSEGKPGSTLGGGITTDPQGLLNGASSGLASDGPVSTTVQNPDGSTTTITKTKDPQGNLASLDIEERDSNGTVTQLVQRDFTQGGTTETTHTARRQEDGSYSHSTGIRRQDGSGDLGSIWTSDNPYFHNVDPDSMYGRGSGELVRPGHKKSDPKMVTARNRGVGPSARPSDASGATEQNRLNVDLHGTVVNPGLEGELRGPAVYNGYNPNDFVRPQRDK